MVCATVGRGIVARSVYDSTTEIPRKSGSSWCPSGAGVRPSRVERGSELDTLRDASAS